MSQPDRIRIATFHDGSQVMLREWQTDQGTRRATAAHRPDKWATWGPPVDLEEAP